MEGGGTIAYRSQAIRGTPFASGPYRAPFESQCSLCQGTRWVNQYDYDRLCKSIKEVKPESPDRLIDNPTRMIDLDDTKK